MIQEFTFGHRAPTPHESYDEPSKVMISQSISNLQSLFLGPREYEVSPTPSPPPVYIFVPLVRDLCLSSGSAPFWCTLEATRTNQTRTQTILNCIVLTLSKTAVAPGLYTNILRAADPIRMNQLTQHSNDTLPYEQIRRRCTTTVVIV